MKRTLICAALALGVATLPLISEARGDDRGNWGRGGYSHGGYGHGYDRGYYRGHGDYHGGGYRGDGVWPWLLGAAAVGAVVSIANQPYYGGTTVYYDDPPPPPPPTVYYGPSYGYVAPAQTCTYYPDGSSYCR